MPGAVKAKAEDAFKEKVNHKRLQMISSGGSLKTAEAVYSQMEA